LCVRQLIDCVVKSNAIIEHERLLDTVLFHIVETLLHYLFRVQNVQRHT
jgi:hypothetical protein